MTSGGNNFNDFPESRHMKLCITSQKIATQIHVMKCDICKRWENVTEPVRKKLIKNVFSFLKQNQLFIYHKIMKT